jgi:hypothetical protein
MSDCVLEVGLFANKKDYFGDPKLYTILCGQKASKGEVEWFIKSV